MTRYGTADDVLTAPPVNTNTVQTMCAGCHLTGWERYQDTATGQYLVRAVNDPGGDMNIDDDPEPDEINVGCESCHGPGSEHVANAGRSGLHRQPQVSLGGAVQRGLRPVPRPKAGIMADRLSAIRRRSARQENWRGPESAATN